MVLSLGGVDLTSVPKKLLQDVHWFLPANATNLDGVHLRLDSRIFLYEHDLCSESIALTEVYAIKSKQVEKQFNVGFCLFVSSYYRLLLSLNL